MQFVQLDENGNVQGIASGNADGPLLPESLRGVPARHLTYEGGVVRKKSAKEIAAIEREKTDRQAERGARAQAFEKARDKSMPLEERFNALMEALGGSVS